MKSSALDAQSQSMTCMKNVAQSMSASKASEQMSFNQSYEDFCTLDTQSQSMTYMKNVAQSMSALAGLGAAEIQAAIVEFIYNTTMYIM